MFFLKVVIFLIFIFKRNKQTYVHTTTTVITILIQTYTKKNPQKTQQNFTYVKMYSYLLHQFILHKNTYPTIPRS